VCLWQAQERLLVSADLLMGEFVSFCDVGSTPDPTAEYEQAVDRVADLDVATAFPGHGRPITDTAVLVQLYRDGLASRASDFEAALQARPVSTAELARNVLGVNDQLATGVWRFLEAHCYLSHLALEQRAAWEGADDDPDRGWVAIH
jgi:glyoxylase-like metal-dependent hydrolase (beta-lactamase superfamily II)